MVESGLEKSVSSGYQKWYCMRCDVLTKSQGAELRKSYFLEPKKPPKKIRERTNEAVEFRKTPKKNSTEFCNKFKLERIQIIAQDRGQLQRDAMT